MATRLIEAGGYKRDNEILAKQVHELLEHNKELSKELNSLKATNLRISGRVFGANIDKLPKIS